VSDPHREERGVLNDPVPLYFADATLASAFVAPWCLGSKVETGAVSFRHTRTSRRRGLGRSCTGRREAIRAALKNRPCGWEET
jgi:hypothetical protein